jgi:hypothetical protein
MPVRYFVRGSVKNVLLSPRRPGTTHVMRFRMISSRRFVSEPGEKVQQTLRGGAQEACESGCKPAHVRNPTCRREPAGVADILQRLFP